MNTPGERAAVVWRVLPAPPEVVGEEWPDADAVSEWMCSLPARATKVELDSRIGGRLRIEIDDRGVQMTVTGTYVALDRPRRISFTWLSSTWEAVDPDSVVTVSLEPHGEDQTLMTNPSCAAPASYIDAHERGWRQVAAQLEARLGSR